jgi:MFS family permease
MVFLLLMELTSSSHTSLAGNLALVSYTFGEVLAAIFARVALNWLNLKWLTTGYVVLILPYLYFVPESPYWLFSKKKYPQLEVCLRKIATTNGHPDSEWFPHYEQLTKRSSLVITSTRLIKRTKKEKIVRFLPRLGVSGLVAFITMLLYIKISYGLGAMNNTISPYWNIVIGAVIESIGYVSASILVTTRLGRKYALMLFASLTTICVLAIPFIVKSHPVVTVVIAQMGKLMISGAVSVSWVYVPELFPTSIRGLGNAVFVFVGRFGAIIAPIIDTAVGEKYIKITFYVYSALTLLVVGVVCLLPETRNRSFDDGEETSAKI